MLIRKFYALASGIRAFTVIVGWWLLVPNASCPAGPPSTAIQPAEQLLPENTLLFATAPDFSRLKQLVKKSPEGLFWNDSAMRSFRENFYERWGREIATPLEREVGIDIAEVFGLAEGRVWTLAAGAPAALGAGADDPFDAVLLVDTGRKSSQLATNLTQLRNRWRAAGKSMRTEKVRDCELMIVAVTTNDLPKSLRQLLPQRSEIQDLGANGEVTQTKPPKAELTIGQSGTLLLIGDSVSAAEKVLARVGRAGVPCLADNAIFQESCSKTFRDSQLYGWVNVKGLMDGLTRDTGSGVVSADPLAPPSPLKMLNALGLGGVTGGACAVRFISGGGGLCKYLAAPETTRGGFFKVLAGTPKDEPAALRACGRNKVPALASQRPAGVGNISADAE